MLEGNWFTWPPRSPDLTVCDSFLWRFVKDNVYVPALPKTLPELQRAHQHRSRERHTRRALRGFGGNGSIAWTSAVLHVGRTSNAFKVTMKLQTFLFQMVVTSCIYVQYLLKYGLAKSSDNLYTPCTTAVDRNDKNKYYLSFLHQTYHFRKKIASFYSTIIQDLQWFVHCTLCLA